jgi:MFS family permease
MSQAVVPIQQELGLTNTEISYVMMAFTLAYGLCEVPTGRLGDRFGSRAVLTRIVIWWSVFTALTGACTGLLSLIAVRLLFGAGEAGAFPNAARVLTQWFPMRERGRVQGMILAAAQFGAVCAPAAAASLIQHVGWRWTFSVFGLVGLVWAVGFWWWFRDDPATHNRVNSAELAAIHADGPLLGAGHYPVPWQRVLSNRGILTLGAIVIFGSFYTYFFYSWFQKYLSAVRGIDNVEAGRLASLVLAGSAAGMLLGGWLADRLPLWVGDSLRARRWLGTGSYLIAAVCLFVGARCDDPWALAALWGASFCAFHVALPNWWAVVIPQCGRHVGALSGLMNGLGAIGALASQWMVGAYTDYRKGLGYDAADQWGPLLHVYVVALLAGAMGWFSYRFQPIDGVHDPQ